LDFGFHVYFLLDNASCGPGRFSHRLFFTGRNLAFISLIEEQRFLEKEGIRHSFVYIGGATLF